MRRSDTPNGSVRHERRIHPEKAGVKIHRDVITSFLAGGVVGMDYAQEIHRLWGAYVGLKEAMKFIIVGIMRFCRLLERWSLC